MPFNAYAMLCSLVDVQMYDWAVAVRWARVTSHAPHQQFNSCLA
jgi:hypothetical protein